MEQKGRAGRQINITSATQLYGVLGHPVGHSLSPLMQNAAIAELGLDAVYLAFDVAPDRLEPALRGLTALGIGGVNLTIPLKERVLPYLDQVSPEAARIGAVNTVKRVACRLEGYNTDAAGFLASLQSCGVDTAGKRCVILGSGGAARAVAVALAGTGARLWLANRTVERASELARILNEGGREPVAQVVSGESAALERVILEADLLVNTTSVGMAPHAEDPLPVPARALHPHLFVYDLIYNPAETRLLAAARQCGARVSNGIGMLAHQGALALEIWTGRRAPAGTMERVLREALNA